MKVSIIIPALNAALFLERAIRSAIRAGSQVRGGWEVIIVNNGSTDLTGQIAGAFVRSHPTHVRFGNCATPGAPAARNHGVALSHGEWLQFLDADDTLDADKIADQLSLAGTTDWVVGGYRHLYPDGNTLDTLPHPDLWFGLFHGYRTGCTHANLLRRTALYAAGGWDESLTSNQDCELWFQLLRTGAIPRIDPTIKSYYHHHDAPRITNADPAGKQANRVRFLADANDYLFTTRPTYWQQHAPYFLGALLRAVRMLATHDLPAASAAYASYFGAARPWPLPDRPLELMPRYTRLYPTLGFAPLECSRLLLTRYLHPALKQLLKS
ncbi:glycosyltransferase [Neolewinella sp.]|uniref:glycosyltransferase n=1 Tax=Neolewinella sp. TaxID=2993543 RepID=UPI003B52EA6E